MIKKEKVISLILLFLMLFPLLLAPNTAQAAEPSPHRYIMIPGYFGYWVDGNGEYWYQEYFSQKPTSLGTDPTGKTVNLLCTPFYVPNYEEVTKVMDYRDGWDKSKNHLLEPSPPSPIITLHYIGRMTTIEDIVGYSGQNIAPALSLRLNGPSGAEKKWEGV